MQLGSERLKHSIGDDIAVETSSLTYKKEVFWNTNGGMTGEGRYCASVWKPNRPLVTNMRNPLAL